MALPLRWRLRIIYQTRPSEQMWTTDRLQHTSRTRRTWKAGFDLVWHHKLQQCANVFVHDLPVPNPRELGFHHVQLHGRRQRFYFRIFLLFSGHFRLLLRHVTCASSNYGIFCTLTGRKIERGFEWRKRWRNYGKYDGIYESSLRIETT